MSHRKGLGDQAKRALADTFIHDVETAERHYDVKRGAANAIHGTEMMMTWLKEAEDSSGSEDSSDEEGVAGVEQITGDGETEVPTREKEAQDATEGETEGVAPGIFLSPELKMVKQKCGTAQTVPNWSEGLHPFIDTRVKASKTMSCKKTGVVATLVAAGPTFEGHQHRPQNL